MNYCNGSTVVEAFKLNERGLIGEDWFWDAVSKNEIITRNFGKFYPDAASCEIKNSKGTITANTGDYIFRDSKGEIHACTASIFESTYKEIN